MLSSKSTMTCAVLVTLALAGCQQQAAPGNQATEMAAQREREKNEPKSVQGADKLAITLDGNRNEASQGSWAHVRVMQAGRNVMPSEGLCEGEGCNPGRGWSQTDPGVYVYSFTPAIGPKTIVYNLDRQANPELIFSTTNVSGKVKVSWLGEEKIYDLYQQAGSVEKHAPLKLGEPLRETY